MSETPILFSGPMVRAILDGRKTQTRRVVKNPPREDMSRIVVERFHPTVIDRHGDEQPGAEIFGAYDESGEWGAKFPYGQVGDRLWVRETWARYENQLSDSYVDTSIAYRADGAARAQDNGTDLPWRPSIHMPRKLSRLTLEITDVRVQRLNDISEEDACAEGFSADDEVTLLAGIITINGPAGTAKRAFGATWHNLNAKRGYGWDANPWVWAISFRCAPDAGRTT